MKTPRRSRAPHFIAPGSCTTVRARRDRRRQHGQSGPQTGQRPGPLDWPIFSPLAARGRLLCASQHLL